jgi:hypothetical protein
MTEAHGNLMVGIAFGATLSFFFQQIADNAGHVRTAVEMFGLIKGTVGLARDLPEIREVWGEQTSGPSPGLPPRSPSCGFKTS